MSLLLYLHVLRACSPASPEQEGVGTGIRVCVRGGFCPRGLGERNVVTETAVCIQEGPSSSVAQGIPCKGSLCLCRVSLALQAQRSGR